MTQIFLFFWNIVYQYFFMVVFVQVLQLFRLKLLACMFFWRRSLEGLKGFVKELERAFNLFEEVNSTDGLQYNVHLCDLNQGLGSAGAAFPCVCVCLCLCVWPIWPDGVSPSLRKFPSPGRQVAPCKFESHYYLSFVFLSKAGRE